MKSFFNILFFSLIFFLLPLNGSGQSYTTIQSGDIYAASLQGDFNHLIDVSTDLFMAPGHFETHDWHNLMITISLTSLLFSVDPSVDKFARANQSETNDQIFGVDKYFGGKETFFLTMGVYGAGLVTGEKRLRRTGLMAFEAFVLSQAVTKLLKLTFGRIRPYASRDPMNFRPFNGGDLFSSLPSGHTTGAFSFAIVMSHAYESVLWKTFWYSSAALVGASRIYNQRHWLSDTFLSFVISYSIAEFVMHYHAQRSEVKNPTALMSVFPLIHHDVLGITLSVHI